MDKPKDIARVAKVTAGFALLPVGVALLVLPGPGLPVVALSLMLLEDDFHWAGKARVAMNDLGRRGMGWVRDRTSR